MFEERLRSELDIISPVFHTFSRLLVILRL